MARPLPSFRKEPCYAAGRKVDLSSLQFTIFHPQTFDREETLVLKNKTGSEVILGVHELRSLVIMLLVFFPSNIYSELNFCPELFWELQIIFHKISGLLMHSYEFVLYFHTIYTICPRRSDPFYIVSHYIKFVTSS